MVGQTILIDVTANDTDPDGDLLTVVDVTQPTAGGGVVSVGGDNRVQFIPAGIDDEVTTTPTCRFTYTISDGRGHEVVGDVTVTVLAEALPDPPSARDDSTFTFVDEAVTIDVLRNDRDLRWNLTIVGSPGAPGVVEPRSPRTRQVRFDPPARPSGVFRCPYEVTNSAGRAGLRGHPHLGAANERTPNRPVAATDSVRSPAADRSLSGCSTTTPTSTDRTANSGRQLDATDLRTATTSRQHVITYHPT